MSEWVAFIPIKCGCGGDVHWDAGYRCYRCQFGHNVSDDDLPPFMRPRLAAPETQERTPK